MSGANDKDHDSIMEIDGRLTTHEAICAERWKTVFNQLEGNYTNICSSLRVISCRWTSAHTRILTGRKYE